MRIVVQLFAGAREAAGRDSVALELPRPVTARQVLDSIGQQVPELEPLARTSRVAVAGRYAADDAPIDESSDVAMIPPVSGG